MSYCKADSDYFVFKAKLVEIVDYTISENSGSLVSSSVLGKKRIYTIMLTVTLYQKPLIQSLFHSHTVEISTE